MTIRLKCSHCGKGLLARDEQAGKRLRCPGCHQVVTAPAQGSAVSSGPITKTPAPYSPPARKAPARPMRSARQAGPAWRLWLVGPLVLVLLLGGGLLAFLLLRPGHNADTPQNGIWDGALQSPEGQHKLRLWVKDGRIERAVVIASFRTPGAFTIARVPFKEAPITGGAFALVQGNGSRLTGTFTTSSEAHGEASLRVNVGVSGEVTIQGTWVASLNTNPESGQQARPASGPPPPGPIPDKGSKEGPGPQPPAGPTPGGGPATGIPGGGPLPPQPAEKPAAKEPSAEPPGKEPKGPPEPKAKDPEKPAVQKPSPPEPRPEDVLPLLGGNNVLRLQVAGKRGSGSAGGRDASFAMLKHVNDPVDRAAQALLGILRAYRAETDPQALLFLRTPVHFGRIRAAVGPTQPTPEEVYFGAVQNPFGRQELTVSTRREPGMQRLYWHRCRWLSLGVVAGQVQVLRVERLEDVKGVKAPGPEPKEAVKPPDEPGPLPGEAGGTAGKGPATYLPASARLVVTVNVRQIVESPLVRKQFLAKLQEALRDPGAEKTQRELGLDPLRDIRRVTVAAADLQGAAGLFAVVEGKFDAARFRAFAAKEWQPDQEPDGRGGKYRFYEQTGGRGFIALADRTTLLFAADRPALVEALARAAGRKAPAPEALRLWAPLEAPALQKAGAALALLGSLPGPDGVSLRQQYGVEKAEGAVFLDEDLRVNLTAETTGAAAARKLAATLRATARVMGTALEKEPALKNDLHAVRVSTRANAVVLEGRLSAEALRGLQALVQQRLLPAGR